MSLERNRKLQEFWNVKTCHTHQPKTFMLRGCGIGQFFPSYWRSEQFLYRIVVFENNLSLYFIQALYPVRNLTFIASGTVAFSQRFARSQTMIGSIRWILIEKLRYWCWYVSSSELNVRSCTLEDVKEAATLGLNSCRRWMLYHYCVAKCSCAYQDKTGGKNNFKWWYGNIFSK